MVLKAKVLTFLFSPLFTVSREKIFPKTKIYDNDIYPQIKE